jgi:uncharacterized protein YjbJ (UPF0337 family)
VLPPRPYCDINLALGAAGVASSYTVLLVEQTDVVRRFTRHRLAERGCRVHEGKWKEMRGKVRERWGKLTDDDLDVVAGKRDQLVGILQQRYGLAKNEIEREVSEFERSNEPTEARSGR